MIKTKQTLQGIRIPRLGATFMFLAMLLLTTQAIFAQGNRGTIRGTVTDQNGAVVPNATVKLVDVAKGASVRTNQTNDDGVYQMLEVEPSTYNLIIEAANFAEYRAVKVRVEPNRNLTLDVSLSVGQVTNEVTVTAGAELIDRESATLGTTVENRRVEGLPLDGRNVLSLALLQPGAAPADPSNTGSFGSGSGIRINGGRGVENNLTLDGANNNEVAVGGPIGGTPRPDAIQEFRLLTSNFEAEFGRNTGGVINLVTKSGTNEYHGNGRFFYRPTFLSAARFLDKALPPTGTAPGTDLRRSFERKEYGFNIGGPIYFLNFGEGVPKLYNGKDRSYFFVDFERRWQNIGQSSTISGLPTPAELSGDFSTDNGRVCANGVRGICDPVTGNPFPGGIIPGDRVSPIAQYYLQFFPTGDANGQAQASGARTRIRNYVTMRFDHSLSENHILNFTANYFDDDDVNPFAFRGAVLPGFGAADRRKARNYVAKYTAILKPNLVNSFLVNISKNKVPGVAPLNTTSPAEIGFTADFVANDEFAGPPFIRLFDRRLTFGNTIQGPQARVTENYQIQDSVSWVLGSHRMKFGVDFTKYKGGQDFLFVNQGLFQYSGCCGGNTTGDDFADFLIGNTPITTQYGAAGRRDFRQLAYAGFAQDTFNVTRNLTLSYGLRYEYTSPLKDLEDRVAYYRPGSTSPQLAAGSLVFEGRNIVASGALPDGLVFVGDPDNVLGGTVPRGGVAPDKNNWAPRAGFAYSFEGGDGFLGKILGTNQTVIRGAMGLYYGAVIGDTALQQLTAPGYNGTNEFNFNIGGTLADPFGPDPFPLLDGVATQRANPFLSTSNILIGSVIGTASQPLDPNLRTPQVTQFNLTFERAFYDDYVLSLSYVGNRGRKQYVSQVVNPSIGTFVPGTVATGTLDTVEFGIIPNITTSNGTSRQVNPSYTGGLGTLKSAGNSTYDGFQANLQKRFSDDGLLFQVAYTFSKSINDSDTQRAGIDVADTSFGRGLSNDDLPHRFVGSFIYELPFFKNKSGFLGRLLDGWSFGGIYTYQSGTLFNVFSPTSNLGTGGIVSFVDIGAAYQQLNPQDNDRQAFNTDAFVDYDCSVTATSTATGRTIVGILGVPTTACPNGFRRGTAGRNQFRLNNPTNNWDTVLTKKTQLFSETNILELRFEVFNLLNKPQFTTVDSTLTSLSFGKYTGTRESRIIQLGARVTF